MAGPSERPPETWNAAENAVRRVISPIQRFLAIEASSGILLMLATVVALVWANTSAASHYEALWHTSIGLEIGEWRFARPLHFWVNDGLMTIFFFVVGLEIRREMHEGELSDLRRAALPLAAALGGMLIPAAICAALNAGRAGSAGWAIPMATDIAFAVGVLTLLGSRVPPALRVLLLALAVIDDIGAIVVIAIFYSGGVDLAWLAGGVAAMAAVATLRGLGVRAPLAYVAPGVALWAALYQAGIHPTLAGVILGMMTPVRSWFGRTGFAETVAAHAAEVPRVEHHEALGHLDAIGRARREAVSPSSYLQHILHPWVAYGVMPVFAFANAGVGLGGADLDADGWFLFVGVLLGLAVGKPLGIFVACRVAIGTRLSVRPRHVSDRGLGVVGLVAGIGFTMSLFIAQLAFPDGPLLQTAKLSVLAGSGAAMLVAGIYGVLALSASRTAGSEHEAESDHEV